MITALLLQSAVAFVTCALSQFLVTQIALLPVRRIGPQAHWSDRARRGWALRSMITFTPLIGVAALPTSNLESRFFLAMAGFVGALLGSIPALRHLYRRRITVFDLLREFAVFFFVLAPAVVVFVVMMVVLFRQPADASTTVPIMACGLIGGLVLTLYLGVPIAKCLGILGPASERLTRLVHEAAISSGQPMPQVQSLRWHQSNAFAFPFARMVAFTSAAEETLTDAQITAVAAHELAHLAEPLPVRLVRLCGVLVLFPIFTIPVWIRYDPVWGILLPALCLLVGSRLLRGFARKMELKADLAAQAHGQDEQALARALEQIYQHNLVPAVMRGSRGQTHPHLYDRMIDAGLQPDFPRPRQPGFILTLFCIVLFAVSTGFLSRVSMQALEELPSSRSEIENEI